MFTPAWWKERAWRSLWTLISCGLLCLVVLGSDLGSGAMLENYADRLPSGHFIFRAVFLCLGLLTIGGFFAPVYEGKKKKAAFRLKSVLTDVDAWIWLVFTCLTVLLLPQDLGFLPQAQQQIYHDGLWLRFALVLYALAAGIFVMTFGGGMAPMDKDTHPFVFGLLLGAKGLGLAAVFSFAAATLPAIVMGVTVLASLPSIVSPPLIVGVVLLILVLSFGGAFLAYRKKKRFWKRLKKLCEEKSFILSEEQSSFSRLFFAKKYSGGVLRRGERCYSFRLCGLRRALTPAVFFREGKGYRLHVLQFGGVKLVQWKTEFSFAVEGEGEKVVILCPCPKRIFITKENGTLMEADNGDRPVDRSCTLYTVDGFLNFLDRLPLHSDKR